MPMSITALTGDSLARQGATTLQDIASTVPGLSTLEYAPGQSRTQLRGISSATGAPTIGLYLDELPINVDTVQLGADVRFIDLERIEVLRGPQGTLYGEGSMGGTIKYVTRSPDLTTPTLGFDTAFGSVADGSELYRANLIVNMPVVADKFGVRFAGGYEQSPGWIDYPLIGAKDVNEGRSKTARLKSLWQVSDALKASLLLAYQDRDYDGQAFADAQRTAPYRVLQPSKDENRLANLVLEYDAGPFTVLSSTGYLDRDQTFNSSTAIYHCDVASHRLTTLVAPQIRLDDINVSQRFARSLDGTRVPYFVVHRKDVTLDSPRPALITAYGGFNVSLMPTFLVHLAPFVQAGGVLIQANLRGGGEYGKHWHEAGRLACKWNVFLDLFAVAEQVIADGVTRPDRFAMMGGSNGGLLAGAAIVHRAVVPVVPIFDQMEPLPLDPQYDPVRSIFFEDYGDPAHPAMSKVLYSYSPYHNVRDGVAYPAVFQVFGEKDLGCMPFHGRKFTARLQAATTSGRPVLLRVWKNTGHGPGDKETALLQPTEWVGFIMRELGMQPA